MDCASGVCRRRWWDCNTACVCAGDASPPETTISLPTQNPQHDNTSEGERRLFINKTEQAGDGGGREGTTRHSTTRHGTRYACCIPCAGAYEEAAAGTAAEAAAETAATGVTDIDEDAGAGTGTEEGESAWGLGALALMASLGDGASSLVPKDSRSNTSGCGCTVVS